LILTKLSSEFAMTKPAENGSNGARGLFDPHERLFVRLETVDKGSRALYAISSVSAALLPRFSFDPRMS
jgi:hypothetical protein